jgi:hypothetical protein
MRRTLTRLSTTLIEDATLNAPTVYALYKCPKRRRVIIDHVRAHSNSASLAGMNDLNFGGGPDGIAPVWKDAADISSMTTAQMEMKLTAGAAVVILDGDASTAANRTFVVEVAVSGGSTNPASVVLDVYGYLIDS